MISNLIDTQVAKFREKYGIFDEQGKLLERMFIPPTIEFKEIEAFLKDSILLVEQEVKKEIIAHIKYVFSEIEINANKERVIKYLEKFLSERSTKG